MRRSAEFVTASAVGMAAGPAFAAVVNRAPPFTAWGLHFDSRTNAAWLLAISWNVYICALVKYFIEPTRPPPPVDEIPAAVADVADGGESGAVPLLSGDGGHAQYGAVPDARGATNSAPRAPRRGPLQEVLRNPPVLFCLFLYFVIKLVRRRRLSLLSPLLISPFVGPCTPRRLVSLWVDHDGHGGSPFVAP